MPDAVAAADGPFAIVGRVRNAHGIRGELVVETMTDAPGVTFAPGRRVTGGSAAGDPLPAAPALTVRASRPFKGGLIISFEEIADRDVADHWRERCLLIPMSELAAPADDEVYLHDLPGLAVFDLESRPLGVVTGWFELPQGILLEVRRGQGTELIPYRLEFVREVDVPRGRLVVELPDGLLEPLAGEDSEHGEESAGEPPGAVADSGAPDAS